MDILEMIAFHEAAHQRDAITTSQVQVIDQVEHVMNAQHPSRLSLLAPSSIF